MFSNFHLKICARNILVRAYTDGWVLGQYKSAEFFLTNTTDLSFMGYKILLNTSHLSSQQPCEEVMVDTIIPISLI